ncbi:MFS transporter [Paenibacillus oryzae]|uniref:MFS transporter n=1 Tax=Paenibacillus oryzae TaxID=1844972 RepID=A0A1A5YN29_9BACL|nr:MFS transporter [Paenibacillus oryzae]OBR67014.1 MFS transporter [Paenibacillus oryzae]
MATWFLLIIYLAFISLGLPDSLLGSAWPVMQPEIGASFGSAGILSMIIAGGTIVSSLASGTIVGRLGVGKVTLISCLMTAGALVGFSVAPSFVWLAVLAIPLGLGAGSVDAGLNQYVAENYKAHHMSWLHCFWGVGATTGPLIMSAFIAGDYSWRGGYAAVAIIQFALVVVLFLTLPLWERVAEEHKLEKAIQNDERDFSNEEKTKNETKVDPEFSSVADASSGIAFKNKTATEKLNRPAKANLFAIKGIKPSLAAFLLYCGAESMVGLWGASFLVGVREVTAVTAAGWVSMYYGGITIGRLITGFITLMVSNVVLIRCGQIVTIAGGLLLILPLPAIFSLAGFVLVGLGLAPIYPGLLHETPARFGKENSARLMGYQMAVAYTGSTFLPPLFGVLATKTSVSLFPLVLLIILGLMLFSAEKVNLALRKPKEGIRSGA